MSELFIPSLPNDLVPAFAAATHQARQMFSSISSRNSSRNSNSNSSRRSSGKDEIVGESTEAIFDEFGAFEPAHGEPEQNPYLNEIDVEDEDNDEEIRRMSEQMKRGAIPTQKNSPGLKVAAKTICKQELNKQEPQQKASHTAAIATGEPSSNSALKDSDVHHSRAATDPMTSAALSRMRYYRKLIPAPKPRTSPKSDPPAANHLATTSHSAVDEKRRFFPPSQSTAALFYNTNRSLPMAIPLKKLSPTNDDSHRFRTSLHPRIAADSSFILPAASYLPSAAQKSFVPSGETEEAQCGDEGNLHRDSLKDVSDITVADEKDEPFGFEFEMDM